LLQEHVEGKNEKGHAIALRYMIIIIIIISACALGLYYFAG